MPRRGSGWKAHQVRRLGCITFRHSYLVCATQRSGSTLLCELLKGTGVAGCPEEYFEAMRDTGIPPHPGDYLDQLPDGSIPPGIRDDPTPPAAPEYSDLRGLSSYREHLERSFTAGTTPNGVFGAKLMFNQLPELQALAGQLPEYAGLDRGELLDALFQRPAYVWVTRRDAVRQAVSLWRALQSRRWRAGDPGDDRDPVYSFMAIDHLVGRFEAEERGWGEFFAGQDISPLRLSYEDDLERDPRAAVSAVLKHVGVSAPDCWRPAEPTARQADARSDEWIATYHHDRARLRAAAVPARPPVAPH